MRKSGGGGGGKVEGFTGEVYRAMERGTYQDKGQKPHQPINLVIKNRILA